MTLGDEVRATNNLEGPRPLQVFNQSITLLLDVDRPTRVRFATLTFSRMELGGLEPPTSWVRSRRSPN